jgi:DNA-binding GntR family transcriptional regulator
LDVSRQGEPVYRRTADKILSMIASGKLGQEFTVPEVQKRASVNYYAARAAAKHLAERGLIEPYQGSGYRALVTPEEAAGNRVDDRPFRERVTALEKELADLRKRTGRIESRLATLAAQPRGGKHEQANTAASDGRR